MVQYLSIFHAEGLNIYNILACTHHTVVHLVNQTIDWSKQPRALPHFTNGHLFCYSFFLLNGNLQVKKIDAFPMLC